MGKDNKVAPEEEGKEKGGAEADKSNAEQEGEEEEGDAGADDGESENTGSFVKGGDRKCRDLPCCILFLVFWIGMIAVFLTALNAGEPERLLYGIDYEGLTCGVDNSGKPPEGFMGDPKDLDFTDKKLLFFPIMGQKIDASNPADTVLFGICVKQCPEEISMFPKCGCLNSGVKSASDEIGQGMFPSFNFGCGDYSAPRNPDAWKTATLTSPPAMRGKPHDCICKNDGSKCYDVSFPTKEIMFRCIPWSDANKTVVITCKDADGNIVDPEDDSCRTIMQEENSISQKPKVELPIVEQLQGFATTLGMMMNDVALTWQFIVGIGGGVAMLLGFLWLVLMKMFAGTIVWCTILALIVAQLVGTFVCAMKSGILSMDDLNAAAQAACDASKTEEKPEGDPDVCFDPEAAAAKLEAEGGGNAINAEEGDDQSTYTYAFYALAVLTVLTIVIVIVKRKAIQIAVGIIKEASEAVKSMPLLVVFPLIPFVLVMVVFAYWLLGHAFIYTAENVSMGDLTSTLNEMGNATSGALGDLGIDVSIPAVNLSDVASQINSAQQSAAAPNATANNDTVSGALGAVLDGNLVQKGMMAYHFFGYLWTSNLIVAITMVTISGAVCSWYFNPGHAVLNIADRTNKTPKFAISKALWRTLRYHLGSCCFGSLIIAIVQFLRAVLNYIDNKLKPLQEKNKLVKYVMMALKCCMWCLEKVVKFISRNAYIFIALTGKSFCAAAKASFLLILANLAQIAMVTIISAYLILMGKVAITIGCTAMMYGIFDNAIALGLPWVFTEEELSCCCQNGCVDVEDETGCGNLPGCEWKWNLLEEKNECIEKYYNKKSKCLTAGICSNRAHDNDEYWCRAEGRCHKWGYANASSTTLSWVFAANDTLGGLLNTRPLCMADGSCIGVGAGAAANQSGSWGCRDDPDGLLSAGVPSLSCAVAVRTANYGIGDLATRCAASVRGAPLTHTCPRTCGSCELACGARGGSWHNNSWTSAGNTWDGAVWGDEERVLLTSPILPTVFTLLLAWITASVFMFVYAMAIDTILVCFCEDKEQGGDGNPFFMSKNLKKFVKDNQSKEGGGDTAKP